MFKRRSEKSSKLKIIILGLFAIVGGFFFFRYYMGSMLEEGNGALKAGDLKQAELSYLKVSRLPFSHGRGHDGLGAVALFQGRYEDAKSHFQQVLTSHTSSSRSSVESALHLFIKEGAYDEGEMYRDFITQWQGEDLKEQFLDFAIIALGNFELAKARRYLSNAPPEIKQTKRYQKVLELADQYELNEEIPIVFDRKGEPILVYNLLQNKYEYATRQLFAGWPEKEDYGKSSLTNKDWKNRIFSTIDLDLQRVVHQSMKGFQGSIMLMDPQNGDVIAAYGTEGFSPFTSGFEPGSVIKILTFATLLENEGDVEHYAPKKYPGNMVVDGRLFFDWKTHGQINNLNEGMAVSCNLMFAQMGIDMGWAAMRKTLNRFFDRKSYETLFGKMVFGEILEAPKLDFDLGRISIGLDLLQTTVAGITQIPAAVAGNGMKADPRFLLNCSNILGETYRKGPDPVLQKVFQTSTAKSLENSMVAALEYELGTARRAKVEGIEAAIKTGTAGPRPFDSIMIGILNPSSPKLVFAFQLYQGGKCEINGAIVASRLQSQIKIIAPQYFE